MTGEEEAELQARLAAVECVLEALLGAHLAALEPAAARQQRTALMDRVSLQARRSRSPDAGADATAGEALTRHALGNLLQKALIAEGQLRRRKDTSRAG